MGRYNPTRRGDIELDRCLCGYSRKQNKWVRNGCKRHPVTALQAPDSKVLAAKIMEEFSLDDISQALDPETTTGHRQPCTNGCVINSQVGSDHAYCNCHCHADRVMMNLSDYEIIIRPKPITEFDSIEDLQRWLERQKQPESAQEIRKRQQREAQAVETLNRYLKHRKSS